MKKHLLLLLGVLLALPSLARDFEYTYKGQTITYTVIDEEAKTVSTKSGSGLIAGNKVDDDLILPAHPKDGDTEYTLTKIGDYAFSACYYLTSVIIPNSVTELGFSIFYSCEKLKRIDIEEGNKNYCSIDGIVFNVDKTTIICYPPGKTGQYTIPTSVTVIGRAAFCTCIDLNLLTIPNSVKEIGEYAFMNCFGLTSIKIPAASIGKYAFYYCTGLTSVNIGNSVASIGDYAFCQCTSLTSINIGNSVTSVGDYAFAYCKSLTSITIPDSVVSIGDNAFFDCSSLTSVSIGNSVTSIGDYAFIGCSGIKEAEFASIESLCKIKFNDVFSNPLNYGKHLVIDGEEVTDVVIPNTISAIGNYTFYNCRYLTSVLIPNSVTSIGEAAFNECSSLTSITIPNSVTSISDYAFNSCSSLISIELPNSLTEIGYASFCRCDSLTSVVIPNSVAAIGEAAFASCSSLEIINVGEDNKYYCCVDGVLFNYDKTVLVQCPAGKNGLYNISNTVTGIGCAAFTGCDKLTSVVIPNSIASIGKGAFELCSSLTSIEIPNSITEIAEYTFGHCSGLTSITIPNSVTSIGEWAFNYCIELTSITIPNSVTKIGSHAFYSCTNLKSVILPSSLEDIGTWAFYLCPNIESVEYMSDNPCECFQAYALFDNDVYQNATLYYPTGCKDKFDTTSPWYLFINRAEKDFTGIDDVLTDTATGEIDYSAKYEVYNLNGVKVGDNIGSVGAGMFIIRQGNKVKKISIN